MATADVILCWYILESSCH